VRDDRRVGQLADAGPSMLWATATVIKTPRESAPVPEQEPQPAAAS